jgi:2-oxoglutarate dehydrogenase E2 component (dihydrolipoamide succinyltransferase)
MTVEIKVPESGESISEVEVSEWRKSEGDSVEQDEILVVLETDKASFDLPAPASGKLAKILKSAGEATAVGEVIGTIEEDSAGGAAKEDDGGQTGKDPDSEEAGGEDEPSESTEDRKAEAAKESGPARPQAPQAEDSAPPPEESAEKRASKTGSSQDTPESEQPSQVMPAARRLLLQYDLRPADVRGTGPGGRVLKEDVLRHVERREGTRAGREAEATGPARDDREEEVVRMSLIRRRIAKRLVEAQKTAALLTTFNEVDMSEVITVRRQHQESFQAAYDIKLGFMSFFVKASVDALKRYPGVNAEVRGDDLVYRNYYDIGVAVSTDRGLVVPVLRNADAMSFGEVEHAISDFASRAREGGLKVSELEGGTFTISNGGIYGSLLSTPIVNHPQSGILGLHAIEDRPVARDGEVVIRPMMYVALTYDHRIIDGREAVLFLRRVRECIEDPMRIILET